MALSSRLAALSLVLLLASSAHGCPTCSTPPPPPAGGTCPIDARKLSVCANVLGLLKVNHGVPENEQCCPLLRGLVDLDAAVCLCTAIRANVLGAVVNLNVPVDIVLLLLSYCHKTCPPDFTCTI